MKKGQVVGLRNQHHEAFCVELSLTMPPLPVSVRSHCANGYVCVRKLTSFSFINSTRMSPSCFKDIIEHVGNKGKQVLEGH